MRRYKDEFTRLTGIANTTVFSNLEQSPIWSYQCESEKSKFEKTWFSWFLGVKYSNPDLLSDEQTVNVIMNKPLKFEFQNPGWARRSADQGWTSKIIFKKTKDNLKKLEELYMNAKAEHQELRKHLFGRIDLHLIRSVPIDDPNYTKKDNRKMLTSLLEELRIDNEEQIKKYRKKIEHKMNRYDQKTFSKICQQYEKCREIVQLDQILNRKQKLVDKTESRIQDLYEVLKEKQQKVRDIKQTAHEWISNTKEHQRSMIQHAKEIGDRIKKVKSRTKARYRNHNKTSGPKDFDDSNRIRGENDCGGYDY
jgi:methyl-accepting chemotaxis protein